MKKPTLKEFKNYVGQLFTLIIIGILVCYLFVGIGFRFELDAEFWTLFGIGFAIMLSITSIWYPIAKQKEEFENKPYKKERLEYSILVKRIIDTNNFKGLKKFCETASDTNKTDAIKIKLSKYNIDYELYEKYKKDTSKLDEEKSLDKTQKKKLKKIISKGLSFRFLFWKFTGYERINHNSITTGIDKLKARYDVRNEEKDYDRKVYSAKILTSVLTSLGLAIIVFTGKGFDLGKLAQIMTWIGMIAWNMFTAINNGRKSVSIHRTNYFKKLRSFIEEFCASEHYDTTVSWQRPKIKGDDNESQEV